MTKCGVDFARAGAGLPHLSGHRSESVLRYRYNGRRGATVSNLAEFKRMCGRMRGARPGQAADLYYSEGPGGPHYTLMFGAGTSFIAGAVGGGASVAESR